MAFAPVVLASSLWRRTHTRESENRRWKQASRYRVAPTLSTRRRSETGINVGWKSFWKEVRSWHQLVYANVFIDTSGPLIGCFSILCPESRSCKCWQEARPESLKDSGCLGPLWLLVWAITSWLKWGRLTSASLRDTAFKGHQRKVWGLFPSEKELRVWVIFINSYAYFLAPVFLAGLKNCVSSHLASCVPHQGGGVDGEKNTVFVWTSTDPIPLLSCSFCLCEVRLRMPPGIVLRIKQNDWCASAQSDSGKYNSRCFLDDCDAVLSGRPLGGWHLASLRWGTFLRTEPALRDLWGAAGWGLMAIAHSQPFKNDICLSSRGCYGCFPLLHLRFASLLAEVTWSDVSEKRRPLPVGCRGRPGAARYRGRGWRGRWFRRTGGQVKPRFRPSPPSRRPLSPRRSPARGESELCARRPLVPRSCHCGSVRAPSPLGSPRVIAKTPGTAARLHLQSPGSWVPLDPRTQT